MRIAVFSAVHIAVFSAVHVTVITMPKPRCCCNYILMTAPHCCILMSFQDKEVGTFELNLAAEALHEMLLRDYGTVVLSKLEHMR